ncbi:MAG: AAA family ATPase [Bacteroidales bacterium]|jgi:predicted AAA+ superfamily ATPase|nr:AAA family ATPase [Bacteroidales bacterium]
MRQPTPKRRSPSQKVHSLVYNSKISCKFADKLMKLQDNMQYKSNIARFFKLQDIENDSVFLFGARQTGKTTFLKQNFPNAKYYDLLQVNKYEQLSRNPSLLREELMSCAENEIVIIDEIQKIPQLLDEVQWLIVNKNLRFILSGSSARKLKRTGANLLGGRALTNRLFPLVSIEIPDFDIIKAVNNGMLPRHYLIDNAWRRIQSYVGTYLGEEIKAEALVRNLSSFNRFLEVAALTNGEIVNYQNIASDCGVSINTIKEYFSIISDTLIGFMLPSFQKTLKRRIIQAPKFYYFDVGITNYLLNRKNLQPGSTDFGQAFEQFVILEIMAYLNYTNNENKMSYWRTSTGIEVDIILGDAKVAIEVKSSSEVQPRHIKGVNLFAEEYPAARLIIVSLDTVARKKGNVDIMPYSQFFQDLWSGQII